MLRKLKNTSSMLSWSRAIISSKQKSWELRAAMSMALALGLRLVGRDRDGFVGKLVAGG